MLLGEIKWPPLSLPGIPSRSLPHDLRINHAATRIYASFGLWEVDITNLRDPGSWKVTDHRCEMAAQRPGPWAEIHRLSRKSGRSLCDDAPRPSPSGLWAPTPKVRIIDLTRSPMKILGEVDGPGHGLDWLRVGGRDYVLHSNEGGSMGIMNQKERGDTCKPYPRPSSLGWASRRS